jgi:hypothetical protein
MDEKFDFDPDFDFDFDESACQPFVLFRLTTVGPGG